VVEEAADVPMEDVPKVEAASTAVQAAA